MNMSNHNFDIYFNHYLKDMERYTKQHKMLILKRLATNIREMEGDKTEFLLFMTDNDYINNTWQVKNAGWFHRYDLFLTDGIVEDIISLATSLHAIYTMKNLYDKFPMWSTIYWQRIMSKAGKHGSTILFQFISPVPYFDYPFSFLTNDIAITLDLSMDGYFISLRNDDPITELWRLAETMYGDKNSLHYKQL